MQPKVNILFIEDERNILTFVRKLLYGHNYKVTTAITGTEGLQLINSICPDLILLDLGLPDMDGQTIIRQVREWSDCPIIVISARTNEHEKVKALDLGADDYITKPFGSAELPEFFFRHCAAQACQKSQQAVVPRPSSLFIFW